MTCERVRWLLSLEPDGAPLEHDASLRAHLDRCPDCQAFARALATVDRALAARPLAQPRPGLAEAVVAVARAHPHPAIEQPFARPFLVLAAAVTLLALVGGALLLHYSQSAGPAATWLNPSWPAAASAWLSIEADHAAQAVLPIVAGLIVTVLAAAAGFRASGARPAPGEPAHPRR